MVKLLVWCAGDVTGYRLVSYDVEGSVIESFLAPAALNKRFNYDEFVVLIPSTLFLNNHDESYCLLLRGKSLYDRKRLVIDGRDSTVYDPVVHELLSKGFKSYLIPHGGISHPLILEEQDGVVVAHRSPAKRFNYDFNVTLNSVYAALMDCVKDRDKVELHVDLTHGSNILVTALMLASQVIAEVEELETEESFKLWCAPILGPPEPNVAVKFLNVSKASNIARGLISGTCAWRRLDERLLPIDWYEAVGRQLGPKFRDIYGLVKSILKTAESLLWMLRSGQAPLAYSLLGQISIINDAKERLSKMIYDCYLSWRDLQEEDEPWIPTADVIIKLTDKLVKDLIKQSSNPIDVTTKALQKLYEAQYYDKVIAVAREYAIFLALKKLYSREHEKVEVAGSLWSKIDEMLRFAAQKRDPTCLQMLSYIGLTEDDAKTFEMLRQMRNKLMHGGLSREMNAEITLSANPGRILEPKSDKDKKPIEKSEAKEEAQKVIKLIEKLKTDNQMQIVNGQSIAHASFTSN